MTSLPASLDELKTSYYTNEEIEQLDTSYLPSHIAIIMDGNRRWASRHDLPLHVGHWRGAEALTQVVKAASYLGVKTLTVFAFSTENWKRSKDELKDLMHLFRVYLIKQREMMLREGIRLDAIGDIAQLPYNVKKELEESKKVTESCTKIDLVIALNYGGRDDIKRATKAIAADCLSGILNKDSISEETISSYLDTNKWQDPSLIIRTSGEHRLSNFLLWQASYSEVFLTDVLWPDFTPNHLLQALLEHQTRQRRMGS